MEYNLNITLNTHPTYIALVLVLALASLSMHHPYTVMLCYVIYSDVNPNPDPDPDLASVMMKIFKFSWLVRFLSPFSYALYHIHSNSLNPT